MTESAGGESRYPWRRLWWAISLVTGLTLGSYLLLQAARPADRGVISFSFLLLLPAVICAFLAYVADRRGNRRRAQYMTVPFLVLAVVVLLSALVLQEGVICIVMLAPLWLISGCAGAEIAYRLRHLPRDRTVHCSAVLAIPAVAMMIEPSIPLPTSTFTVTRSMIVSGTPDQLWPLVRGIPDVRPSEGCWNISQDLIGVPRPISARLIGDGVGAERTAIWGDHIRFRERITSWERDRTIGWGFAFDDLAGWGMTDRHLLPNSSYFRVTSGGYDLEPVDARHTRVVLHTTYRIRTALNPYARLWGELLLGDLENNLLALIQGRAARSA